MEANLLDHIVEETSKLSPKRLRIAAALIDYSIFFAMVMVLGVFFGEYHSDKDGFGYELREGWVNLVIISFWFLLYPISESLTGQTIGKRILKIKVVKKDFTKTTVVASLVRHLFDIIDCLFFIGLIIAASNKNNQRIGDFIAGTIVVLKKT